MKIMHHVSFCSNNSKQNSLNMSLEITEPSQVTTASFLAGAFPKQTHSLLCYFSIILDGKLIRLISSNYKQGHLLVFRDNFINQVQHLHEVVRIAWPQNTKEKYVESKKATPAISRIERGSGNKIIQKAFVEIISITHSQQRSQRMNYNFNGNSLLSYFSPQGHPWDRMNSSCTYISMPRILSQQVAMTFPAPEKYLRLGNCIVKNLTALRQSQKQLNLRFRITEPGEGKCVLKTRPNAKAGLPIAIIIVSYHRNRKLGSQKAVLLHQYLLLNTHVRKFHKQSRVSTRKQLDGAQ